MKSHIVCVRLKPEELQWLDKYADGNYSTRGEYLRYLIHSEHRKRTGDPVKRIQVDSEARTGRPKKPMLEDWLKKVGENYVHCPQCDHPCEKVQPEGACCPYCGYELCQ